MSRYMDQAEQIARSRDASVWRQIASCLAARAWMSWAFPHRARCWASTVRRKWTRSQACCSAHPRQRARSNRSPALSSAWQSDAQFKVKRTRRQCSPSDHQQACLLECSCNCTTELPHNELLRARLLRSSFAVFWQRGQRFESGRTAAHAAAFAHVRLIRFAVCLALSRE